MPKRKYTHKDATGMLWRMEGSRPVSAIADSIMDSKFASHVWKNHTDKLKKNNVKFKR